MNLADFVRKLQKDISELQKLVNRAVASATGEANTASNIGAGGVGVYDSKVGVDLRFRNINSASARVSVALDAPNHEVDIDVVQAQIDHGSISGLGDDDHTLYLLASGARALTGDWDAGAAAGRIISSGYLIVGTTTASSGRIRIPNNSVIRGRNALNTANVDIIYVDANDRVLVSNVLCANPSSFVVIGGSTAGIECLTIEGNAGVPIAPRIALKETTAPINDAGYGKIYVKATDGLLYFMDDSGFEYNLCGWAGSGGEAPEGALSRPDYGRNFSRCQVDNTGWKTDCHTIQVTATSTGNSNDADGPWAYLRTSGALGNLAIIRATNYNTVQGRWNPLLIVRIKTPSGAVTTRRIKVGLLRTAPLRSSNLNSNEVAFQYDTTVPWANWYFSTRDGAAQNDIDTGVVVAVGTVYEFKLWTIDQGANWYWECNGVSGATNVNVPSNSQDLGQYVCMYAEAAAVYDLHVAFLYLEWDSRWGI